MKVVSISWIDPSAQEAEVEVADGQYTCYAFCHPCEVNVGDELVEPLHVFGPKQVALAAGSDLGAWRNGGGSLAHRVVARLLDSERRLMGVGALRFVFDDPLPGGIQRGDLVGFECARLDLW